MVYSMYFANKTTTTTMWLQNCWSDVQLYHNLKVHTGKKTKKTYILLQERMETNKYQLYAKSTEIENGFRDILGCGYGNGV